MQKHSDVGDSVAVPAPLRRLGNAPRGFTRHRNLIHSHPRSVQKWGPSRDNLGGRWSHWLGFSIFHWLLCDCVIGG